MITDDAGRAPVPRRTSELRRTILNLVAFWLIIKFLSAMLMLAPGPWGPTVAGVLLNGERIAFRSRFYGRETDDEILITSPGKVERVFVVNNYHAARLAYVRIACRGDGSRVWLESRGKVVASLDLVTDEFTSEGETPMEWAKIGEGMTVAEGYTRGWWQFIVPW